MSPEEQRIAIAEACGIAYPQWECTNPECAEFGIIAEDRIIRSGRALYCPGSQCGNDLSLIDLPDYLNSLDAMHEAEKTLFGKQGKYARALRAVLRGADPEWDSDSEDGWAFQFATATAAQRAEAFLRTLGLWKE